MPQRNRNEERERKGGEPRRDQVGEEKRYPSSRSRGERINSVAKVNNDRTVRMSSDRENDLYERQSI